MNEKSEKQYCEGGFQKSDQDCSLVKMDPEIFCNKAGITESDINSMTRLQLYKLYRALFNGGWDHSEYMQVNSLGVKVARGCNKVTVQTSLLWKKWREPKFILV